MMPALLTRMSTPPNVVDRGGDDALPVVGLGDVEMYVTGRVANVFGDRFAFGVKDVAEDHLGALVDECPNVRGAHPAGAAADDGNLARQPTCHQFLLSTRLARFSEDANGHLEVRPLRFPALAHIRT